METGDYTSLTDIAEMKQWLVDNGPLIANFTVNADLYEYKSGVYRYDGKAAERGGHAVEIIGFDDALRCWIFKNSWGTDWGEKGYGRIGYGERGIDDVMYGFSEVYYSADVEGGLPPLSEGQGVPKGAYFNEGYLELVGSKFVVTVEKGQA